MTATRLAASGSGGSSSGLGAGWFDVTSSTYGATGNGTTDDRVAIQAAMDACKAAGGTVYFPKGTYKVTSPGLVLDNSNTWGVRLLGAGPVMNFDFGASKLLFTGATGSLLSIKSGDCIELANLEFDYNNASFTGDLVNVDGNVPHAADIQEFHMHHCGTQSKAGSITARSCVRLERVIISSIDHCQITGGVKSLYVGEPPGNSGTFMGETYIEKCTFNRSTDCHVFIGTGDGETLVIADCTFEAGTNTTAIRGATVAVDGAGNLNGLYTPLIERCWFGDASSATKWITGLNTINNNFAGTIRGNRFGEVGIGGVHLTLSNAWNIVGNSFDGVGQVYSGFNPVATGNGYDSRLTYGVTPQNGTTELGSSQPEGNAPNRLPWRVWVGPNTNASVADQSETGLVLLTNPASAPAGFASAGVIGQAGGYTFMCPKSGGAAVLASNGGTPVVTVGSSGGISQLSFFNATAITQPARAGQLTDSTGGTVTSTLAAGITDTVAKNAIASLAAKVNALETIIHNLGLSA